MPIITTQKEIDAYNVVKRILEKEGLDPNQLEITDSVEYCDIHVRNQPQAIVVRLYFNDENNLAFSIPQSNGYEEHFQINTLRGISSKKDLIISHFQALIQKIGGVNIVKSTSPHSNINQNSGQIDDLQRREIFPIIAAAIQDRFGNEFEIINLSFEETTNKFYGQFVGLGLQTGRIFNFNLYC